jgi:hypothetical protein
MGKWSSLKGAVPSAPVDSDFQGRVNAAKSETRFRTTDGHEYTVAEMMEQNIVLQAEDVVEFSLERLTPQELAVRFCKLRDEKDALEAQEKKLNLQLEAIQQLMIPKMEQSGMDLFRLTSGDSLSIKDEPYVSIADKGTFLNWIKSSGQEDLLTVHYMTMSAMTKERLQNGQEAPPGLKVFLKQSLTRRRARG